MKGSLVLLSAIVVSGAMAQPFANAFARSSVVTNVAFSEVKPMPNGNFAVAVRSSLGGSYMYILRPSGAVVAGRTLAGFPARVISIKSISVSPTGDVYTVSEAFDTASSRQIYVHKFDSAGTLLWRRDYNPANGAYESVADSVCDAAGNLLFVGHSRATGLPTGGESLSWVMRIRPNAVISFTALLTGFDTRATTLGVSPAGRINALTQGSDRSYVWHMNNVTGHVDLVDDMNAGTVLSSMAMRDGLAYLAGKGIPDGETEAVPYIVAHDDMTSITRWTSFLPVGPAVTGGSFAQVLTDGSGNVIVAGILADGVTKGVIAKVDKSNGVFNWTRYFGATGNDRQFAGLALDRHNEAYFAMRNMNPDGQRIRVEKIGPTGSLRGGVTFPAGSNPTELPLDFAVHPSMGHFASVGSFSTGAPSRWVGWYQQAILGIDYFATVINSPIDVNAFWNDRYVGDVAATVTIPPAHGTLTFNGLTGAVHYEPAIGYEGDDSFTYQIQKPGLPAVTAVANILIDTGGRR